MKRKLLWQRKGLEDYLCWQDTDPKVAEKINQLIETIDRTPFTGIGKPEPLKHVLKGYWSRRINREHRLIYTVNKAEITIIACRYHYEG